MLDGCSSQGEWRNLTPLHLRCGSGGCPAVYRTPVGSVVVVGRALPATDTHPVLAGRVGPEEAAVEIDAEFFGHLFGTNV